VEVAHFPPSSADMTTDIAPLGAQHMKALRHADHVVFNARADGTAEARAVVDEDRSSTGFEQSVTVALGNRSIGLTGRTGFESIRSNNGAWHTFVHHVLRVGDVLSVSFRADYGTSPYVKAAVANGWAGDDCGPIFYNGLHLDEFWLVVDRNGKRMEFLMEARCTPENHARMCSLTPQR